MKNEKEKFQEHELIEFWYTSLNNPQKKVAETLRLMESFAAEEGCDLQTLIQASEGSGEMVKSMCYDTLVKAGRPITEKQRQFLREHPWQKKFWPSPYED